MCAPRTGADLERGAEPAPPTPPPPFKPKVKIGRLPSKVTNSLGHLKPIKLPTVRESQLDILTHPQLFQYFSCTMFNCLILVDLYAILSLKSINREAFDCRKGQLKSRYHTIGSFKHRCKNLFHVFLFRARFYVFYVFILPTFFIFKNVH